MPRVLRRTFSIDTRIRFMQRSADTRTTCGAPSPGYKSQLRGSFVAAVWIRHPACGIPRSFPTEAAIEAIPFEKTMLDVRSELQMT